jgi:hypothetical protein
MTNKFLELIIAKFVKCKRSSHESFPGGRAHRLDTHKLMVTIQEGMGCSNCDKDFIPILCLASLMV